MLEAEVGDEFVLRYLGINVSSWSGVDIVCSTQSMSSGSKPPPAKPTDPPQLVVWCNVTEKEPLSALNRASTTACKQQIVDAHCLQQKQQLFPRVSQ